MYKAKNQIDANRIVELPGVIAATVLRGDGSIDVLQAKPADPWCLLLASDLLEAARRHHQPTARLAVGDLSMLVESASLGDGYEAVAVIVAKGDPVVKSLHRTIRQAWGVSRSAVRPRRKPEADAEPVDHVLEVLRSAAKRRAEVEVTWHPRAKAASNLDGGNAYWRRRGVPIEPRPGQFELLGRLGSVTSWRFVVGEPTKGSPSVIAAREVSL